MTGAAVPPGADAVVMVEDTDFNIRVPGAPAPESVSVLKSLQPGENIRHHGDDLHANDTVLSAGTRLRAQEIGLLAMLGLAEISVYKRPKMALLSSGDELIPVEMPLAPGKIHDANSYFLSALAEACGVDLIQLGVAADIEADVQLKMERAVAEKADVIVSSAGVSVGAFDYIKSIVEANGKLDFWKVDMRPGKPLAFGNYQGIPFFGLPGNPVSAFVGFQIIRSPCIRETRRYDSQASSASKSSLARTGGV